MRWLQRTSIKKKLLVAYLPLIILPIVVISIASYALFSYKMEQASRKLAVQTAEQINRHVETYLDELERLSLFPYFHGNVLDILRKSGTPDTPDETYREYKLFDDMFGNIMLNPRQDLLNVFLYREDGTRYFNTRVNVMLNGDYVWNESDWYRRTIEAGGNVVYTPNAGKDGRFTQLPYDIFSISRAIKSDNGKVVGTILIDANFQGVVDVLRDIGLGADANVILKDGEGRIMFSQNGLYLDELQAAGTATTSKLRAAGHKLFVGNDVSGKTGWTASVVIPSSEIYNSFVSIREIIVWLGVLFGTIALLVTFWMSDSITRPIRTMHRMMKKVENGNYDVELELHTQDEIGSLGRAFNQMRLQIKELIHEVYEYDIRQKEAELNNLKMQIRPHFLYNTLEAIRSLAELQDNREVAQMTSSLGSILRYSIKTHQKLVLLDKEIGYIREYLTIHQIMLGDSIRVEFDIEPSILRHYSIPLMFQPIIENALQHGLYGKRDNGLIRIVGKREGDVLHFTVSDNGKGMSAQALEELNRKLSRPVPSQPGENGDSDGIGLTNVNQRIRIVFGERFGLSADRTPDGGTSIRAVVPVVATAETNAG